MPHFGEVNITSSFYIINRAILQMSCDGSPIGQVPALSRPSAISIATPDTSSQDPSKKFGIFIFYSGTTIC